MAESMASSSSSASSASSPAVGSGGSVVPASIEATQQMLARADYVADRGLAATIFLALAMQRPLFLEGEAGVGKTEIAKVLASSLGRKLIRLQCYEGLDINSAVYEWNVQRQMVEIRLAEARGRASSGVGSTGVGGVPDSSKLSGHTANVHEDVGRSIWSEQFLIRRPILEALQMSADGLPPVLLIDELDRTDEPFEAYLLEVLSDFQVTIPELGTIAAKEPPIVVITSNRTREIHDAVKRRCLYYWVDYPNAKRELEILRRKAPHASETLTREVVAFVQQLRQAELFKLPGVAETIEWTRALLALDALALDPQVIDDTLGVLLKYQDDIAKVQGSEAAAMLSDVRSRIAQLE